MNDAKRINQGSPGFSALFQENLSFRAPQSLALLGNADLLESKKLALICSVKCPGDLILKTFDFMQVLRESEMVMASGFHSPMEKECLRILLKGKQPIIISLPRGIENMRIPTAYRKPLTDGRMLVLSCLPRSEKRVTAETAITNNRFIAALSEAVFVPYTAPNWKTEALCSQLVSWGKKVHTFQHPENMNLIQLGVVPLEPTRGTVKPELSKLISSNLR